MTVIRSFTPREWVIHQYSPDYGIDLVIEVFKYVDEKRRSAETLSELYFVQAKSVEATTIQKRVVRERTNVELAPLQEHGEQKEIEVIPFVIETEELITIQSMSTAAPVLLYLVTLDTDKLYFVCVSDYIEKVLFPENPNWQQQATNTLYIPVRNLVTKEAISLVPLRFYAKRIKFYGAFSKFFFQRRAIERLCSAYMVPPQPAPGEVEQTTGPVSASRPTADPVLLYPPNFFPAHQENPVPVWSEDSFCAELKSLALHFLAICERFTIWEGTEMWGVIPDTHKELIQSRAALEAGMPAEDMINLTRSMWWRLANLSNMYEELCKEWFMPTFLSQLMSYPD